MLRISIGILNPRWTSRSGGRVRQFLFRHWRVTRHKALEIEAYRASARDVLWFDLDTAWRNQDHAAIGFELGVLGYRLEVKLRDLRHWDDETGTWVPLGSVDG
jgi:hypothetical protein